jgi:hypothetical protein
MSDTNEGLHVSAQDLAVHEPDWQELSRATRESAYIHHAVELLKSACTISTYAASVLTATPHDRDSAIRCGLLVRSCKLTLALIRDACRDKGVLQLGLSRQLMETLATLHYLCDDADGARHEAFVRDSLVSEREFLENIRLRVKNSGGRAWAIEERIRHSIDKTAAAAGVDLSKVPSRKSIGWPSTQSRVEAAFGMTAYPAYRVGSDALHGGWFDLYRNHLRTVPAGFEPQFDPLPVRPQGLISASGMLSEATLTYLAHQSEEEQKFFGDPLKLVLQYTLRLDELHEAFLQRLH